MTNLGIFEEVNAVSFALKPTEIRNILGIEDDDTLNAACECERKDDLEEKIVKEIIKAHGYEGGNIYSGRIFKFEKVREILESFGFKYVWADDESEEHWFFNEETNDEVSIFPETYYPVLGNFRFANFLLS